MKGFTQSLVEQLENVAAGVPQTEPWDDHLELGAFGGVADIPARLYEQQQFFGQLVGETPTAGAGKPLIRVQLPLRYARDWTIQLATPTVPQPNPINVGLPSTIFGVAVLRWGHHGASDQVELDWPERGGSLTVHGSFVELLIRDPGAGAPPALTANYTAWMSEGSAARASPWAWQPTKSRVSPGAIPAVGNFLVEVPARARAFYIVANTVQGPITPFQVQFLDNAGVRMDLECNASNASSAQPSLGTVARAPFVLPPHVNGINIVNNGVDIISFLEIVFLLDVGS